MPEALPTADVAPTVVIEEAFDGKFKNKVLKEFVPVLLA